MQIVHSAEERGIGRSKETGTAQPKNWVIISLCTIGRHTKFIRVEKNNKNIQRLCKFMQSETVRKTVTKDKIFPCIKPCYQFGLESSEL